jgi:two-component system, LytTR family, response regulator
MGTPSAIGAASKVYWLCIASIEMFCASKCGIELKPMIRALSVLIVDAEPSARERIRQLLAHDTDVRVVWECESVAQCQTLDSSSVPDLVFLDVELPERDGFDLLHRFVERGIQPIVVFVVAHAKYAVRAYAVGAVDYLLKPFSDERFAKTMERTKAIAGPGRVAKPMVHPESPVEALALRPVPDLLFVSERGRMSLIPVEDIELIQAAGKHVKIFVRDRCYLMREALRNLQSRLDGERFVRVHRSTIVNMGQIVEVAPLPHGDCELSLKRGARVTLSRRFRSALLAGLMRLRASG